MALLGMMGFLLLERLIMILGDLAHQHMNESNVSDASLFLLSCYSMLSGMFFIYH